MCLLNSKYIYYFLFFFFQLKRRCSSVSSVLSISHIRLTRGTDIEKCIFRLFFVLLIQAHRIFIHLKLSRRKTWNTENLLTLSLSLFLLLHLISKLLTWRRRTLFRAAFLAHHHEYRARSFFFISHVHRFKLQVREKNIWKTTLQEVLEILFLFSVSVFSVCVLQVVFFCVLVKLKINFWN